MTFEDSLLSNPPNVIIRVSNMKNFTVALRTCCEGIVSSLKQFDIVQNSELGTSINNRTDILKNISPRNFSWKIYGIFSYLTTLPRISFLSLNQKFGRSGKLFNFLNLFASRKVYIPSKKASIASGSLIGVLVTLFTFSSNVAHAQCTGTSVAGSVFRDFNLNGVKDNNNEIGLAGITVRAFNSSNTQVGTTTTLSNGTYSITGLSGSLRIEFSGLPMDYVSGPDGSTSGTSVQFVTLSSTVGCAVNFGVNHPDDFCAKSGVQPKIAVPCYANGRFDATGTNGAGLEDALVSFPYNRTGDKATSGNAPNLLASYNRIGSVWGMAYNKFNKTLFATAFMKRHSGFGPQGIAGLYVIQNADANGLGTVTGINLQTLLGINAGTQPPRDLPTDKTQPTDDGGNAVFDAVGKMSFGDAELSADGNTLYITNLFDKKVYVLNVTNPLSPTLTASYLVPNPACTIGDEYAPFGLKFYRGKLYVGVICTAQSSQPATPGSTYGQPGFDTKTLSSPNLKATVYELNGSTFTTALTQFPLNFDRGLSNSAATSYTIWRPWVSSWSQVPSNIAETYPQPILSDIEFDVDGSMILGFADRFSHQLGNFNFSPGKTAIVTGRVEGDILRATKGTGNTWTIENNGSASGTTTAGTNKGGGPGGGEYYFGDLTVDHDEPTMGGLAMYPGTGEIMTTVAGPINTFYSGGTRRINNNTGDYLYSGVSSPLWNTVSGYRSSFSSRPIPTGDYKLYEGQNPASFGKASGLGDIEVFCSLAPLEIGNRIWRDLNRNGIQDAGEPGISGITVLLFRSGTQVASSTTDTNGEYYFNDANVSGGLLPNSAYEIRIAINQVSNTILSPANATTDNIDSDASLVGGNGVITLTTGTYGESNHTYDVGFSPNCPIFTNPQANGGIISICSGTPAGLTLTVSNASNQPLPASTNIQWVAFSSAQSNPYTLTGRTVLTPTATLVNGTFTTNVSFPANNGTAPVVYYVYAILNPTPDGSNLNCRPSVAYIVTVNPTPTGPTSVTGGIVCRTGATVTIPLSATCGTNQTPIWYQSQMSTDVLSVGPNYSPSISSTTTYFVACRGTSTVNCESASGNRTAVLAIVVSSDITATAQNSTCNQDTPKNDGAVKLTGTFTGLRYDIVQASTYTGTKTYADATTIPGDGIVKSGIANPVTNSGTTYTVRVFINNNCFTDYTVTIRQVLCSCGEANCVPYGVVKTKSGKK